MIKAAIHRMCSRSKEGGRIIFQPGTREYIDSFRGVFKLIPGEKSVVHEHIEERRKERDRENR